MEPCTKIKDLITSTKTGQDAVAEVVGESFDVALDDYGLIHFGSDNDPN